MEFSCQFSKGGENAERSLSYSTGVPCGSCCGAVVSAVNEVPNTGDDIRWMDDCQQNYNIAVLTYHGIEIRRCHTDLTPQLGGFWLIIRICVSHKQECARIVIFSHSFIAFILVLSRFVCF